MAKAKRKTKKPKRNAASVPCLRIEIGGKPGKRGHVDANSCAVVGERRGAVTKFDLNRKIGATSKSVTRPKVNKPCLGALKRKGCPVQLAFDKGQPFLRFCTANKEPGLRVNVNSPAEAAKKAASICSAWKETGSFDLPASTPLGDKPRKGTPS